ncbi:MAG: membrane protein, putative [uncultured Sulfurovum sp.]|uniref:Membrane protein, putative n=1 Tax=uncultured Sulfurovum sp. TaxID=269237 RepID=A0A6S6TYV5_9BACT|nr:MAG: membrane protein, putative [uncultured Sulfurovum sp.]
MENIDLAIIISTAFLGSFGHCIGMCGGIVVAYSSSKIDQTSTQLTQTLSHLSYNFGRVATYAMLGAVFGLIGQAVAFTPTTKGILFLLTGLLMLLAGLSLLGKFKFLNSVEFSFSKYSWFQNSFRALLKSKSYKSFFLLGMLNGIIPCGLVYSFAIMAAATASPLWGAIVMATFGLATIPALFFLGSVTKFLQKGSLRGMMMKAAAFLVVVYALFTMYKGYNFVAHPEKMQKMMESMRETPKSGKCGGMKCAPGKCG